MIEKLNLVVNLILVCAVGFLIFRQQGIENSLIEGEKSNAHYFALTQDYKSIEVFPLDRTNLSDDDVSRWSVSAMNTLLNFNKKDYEIKLRSASKYFTKRGWESFTVWLSDTKLINRSLLQSKSLFLRNILLSEPDVGKAIDVQGRLQWTVRIPIKFISSVKTAEYEVVLIVTRSAYSKAPNGLGIEKISISGLL